jgi:hypothetical protein
MILHSINYTRNFSHDYPTHISNESVNKFFKIIAAGFPLLTFHSAWRNPITQGLGVVRTLSHLFELEQAAVGQRKIEIGYYLLQSCLSVASVGLSILNPVYGMIAASVSDIIADAKECLLHLRNGNYPKSFESLARLILSTLYLTTICYGSIELTVALMALQIVLGCYDSIESFKKGDVIEGILTTLVTGMHIHQALPQTKLLYWKYSSRPVLQATLKQDSKGFTYLDIPDEDLKDLYSFFKQAGMELPPYFGPKMAGAHVSVIESQEMRQLKHVPIQEIGQTFHFRIAELTTLKPIGFKGTSKVWFLTLACPQLETVRTRYGLAPRLHEDHDFHLTFAIEK